MTKCQAAGAEIERLLHHWPAVVAAAQDGWGKDFAKSIAKQSGRKGWRPSSKQLSIMREMVAEQFTLHSEEEGGFDVLE